VNVRTSVGPEAVARLRDPQFRAGWDALFQACPWRSVFQSAAFADVWYRAYASRFDPALVYAEGADGQGLGGLLPLARERASGALVHVGAHHAEYQVWLALPGDGDAFIERALDAAAALAPGGRLNLLYAPAAAPLGWTAPGRRWAALAETRPARRGYIELGDGTEIRKTLQKSRYRYRLRQLDKLGGMRLERITTRESLAPWLDTIVDYCDFRQGAVNDAQPFRDDPLKRDFHLAMLEVRGLLDVSLLLAGDTFVSAQLNWCNGEQTVLGLLAHTPHLAKLSPGTLHLLLAARLAADDGQRSFDLTPFGEYKDRFATGFDEVHQVTVHFGRRDRVAASVKRGVATAAKRALGTLGVDPTRARERVRRVSTLTPVEVPAKLARRVGRWTSTLDELRVYTFDVAGATLPPNPALMRRDSVADILAADPAQEESGTLHELLGASLRRLEHDEHVYTRVEDGRLAHRGWMVEDQERALLSEVQMEYAPGKGSVTLYDFFTHPDYRGRGLYRAALTQMLHDAKAAGRTTAHITVLAENGASRHVIEKLGFRYVGSFYRRVSLGRVARWCEPPALTPAAVAGDGAPASDAGE
jgi:CelD/BcsL family acetyltransferase involved in cellulose biosynthesis/GNAT superfamily N-acetyltransferase